MKVLVNGGLNLSELDGWWAEAYESGLGWAIGDRAEHGEREWDDHEAWQIYELLEHQIIPEFYERDSEGLPRRWIERIRASMSRLAPQFSANRTIAEYLEKAYFPAASTLRTRIVDGARTARELNAWQSKLRRDWDQIRFGAFNVEQEGEKRRFRVEVFLGEVEPSAVEVQLYADPIAELAAVVEPMRLVSALATSTSGQLFEAVIASRRPENHFTPRVVPRHAAARIPLEEAHVLWFR